MKRVFIIGFVMVTAFAVHAQNVSHSRVKGDTVQRVVNTLVIPYDGDEEVQAPVSQPEVDTIQAMPTRDIPEITVIAPVVRTSTSALPEMKEEKKVDTVVVATEPLEKTEQVGVWGETEKDTINDNVNKNENVNEKETETITVKEEVPKDSVAVYRIVLAEGDSSTCPVTVRANPAADNIIIQFKENKGGYDYSLVTRDLTHGSGILQGLTVRIAPPRLKNSVLTLTDRATGQQYRFAIERAYVPAVNRGNHYRSVNTPTVKP